MKKLLALLLLSLTIGGCTTYKNTQVSVYSMGSVNVNATTQGSDAQDSLNGADATIDIPLL